MTTGRINQVTIFAPRAGAVPGKVPGGAATSGEHRPREGAAPSLIRSMGGERTLTPRPTGPPARGSSRKPVGTRRAPCCLSKRSFPQSPLQGSVNLERSLSCGMSGSRGTWSGQSRRESGRILREPLPRVIVQSVSHRPSIHKPHRCPPDPDGTTGLGPTRAPGNGRGCGW
jgi:hypothetical protein